MHYLREAPAEVCLIPEAYYPSRVYYAQICTVFISILDIWPLSDLSHIFWHLHHSSCNTKVQDHRSQHLRLRSHLPKGARAGAWDLLSAGHNRKGSQTETTGRLKVESLKSLLMSLIIRTILICHGFPITPHRLGFLSAGRRAIFASDSQYTLRSLRKNMEKLLTACETTDAVGISCSSCRGSWPIMEASN